ncbi:MAG: type I-D CRISPR-associated helicase Cas3' [Caldilineaceae bacterium]
MKIRTLSVYSKLTNQVPPELQAKLPAGWQLSQHQVDTYLALTATDGPDVIFNTAMTGDGKSLAGQLPALVKGWEHSIFATYPTNELIHDQERQVQSTWAQWNQPISPRLLDSNQLDRVFEMGDYMQRGEALQSVLQNTELLLTNPDIFHYIMQFFYRRKGKTGDAPDKIIGELVRQQQFTFDEFHIFETPQIVSVLNAMLLIHAMQGHWKSRFLFQSATPKPLMETYLSRSGLRHIIITGEYLHTRHTPDPNCWRQILQGSDIHFSAQSIDEWITEHLEDTLLSFFQKNHPGAKGAVIVNSVAQAKRLYLRLKDVLEPYGITVGENTGLTSRTQRTASYDCDLLIGTSTVDIGVDFQINFLLFESRDAGSFLQRLGRMGRHKGYIRDGRYISFDDHFEAHALLPRWTLERLFQGDSSTPSLLQEGMETDRQTLINAINEAFPQVADFARYVQRWGGLQSAQVLRELRNPLIRGTYDALSKKLMKQYNDTFQINVGYFARRAKELEDDKQQRVLLDEAIAFRGGSYFTCGILDDQETGVDQVKHYNLLSLIANAELDPLNASDFWTTVDKVGMERKAIERHKPVAYFRLRGFREERTRYWVMINDDLAGWGADRFGVAHAMQGFTIESEFAHEIPGLNDINRALEGVRLPALICAGNGPFDLKRKLRLPLLFPLYELRSRDGVSGSVAFGREALLLEVAMQYRGIQCGGGAIFL